MNFCAEGGYTVNVERPFSDDATDYLVGGLPVVGCNRLRCARCSAWVKSGPRLDLKQGWTYDAVYGAPDLATSPLVKPGLPNFRLYICKCAAWGEQFWHRMEEPEPDLITDPDVPWRCAGHDVVTLPHEFDGVPISGDADLSAAAHRACAGWVPPGAPMDFEVGVRWLARLHGRLAGTDHQDALVRAVADQAKDPSPTVRGRALQFFVKRPTPTSHRLVLDLLAGDRALYAGIPDEVSDTRSLGDVTLEDTLWRALFPIVGKLPSALKLARAEAVTPGKVSRALYDALCFHDADWVSEHVAEIVDANPTAADGFLESAMRFSPEENDRYLSLKKKVTALESRAKA